MTTKLADIYVPSILKFRIMVGNYSNVIFSDLYIPALKKELDSLAKALTKTDKLINTSLAGVEVLLDTTEVNGYLKSLQSAVRRNDQNSIPVFSSELRESIKHVKKEWVKVMDELQVQIDNLATIKISENDVEYRALEKRRGDFMKDLPQDKEALTLIREKRDQIVAAILEYESKTVLDRLMPIAQAIKEGVTTVLDEEGDLVSKTGGKTVATPLAAKHALKIGMEVASGVLNLINEDIKYQQLLMARGKLDADIEIRQKQISTQEQEIDEIDNKRAQLNALRDLVEPRNSYVAEVRKIQHMLTENYNNIFSRDLSVTNELMSEGDAFVKGSPEFSKYLNHLQFYWLRPVR